MVNVAAPVAIVIGEDPLAKGAPPKSPPPALVNVTVVLPPALSDGMMPQTLIHLAFPDGQRPRIRNCPAEAPDNPRTPVPVMPAESATGTPTQNGSLVRATPANPPGYTASWTVSGASKAAQTGSAKKKTQIFMTLLSA